MVCDIFGLLVCSLCYFHLKNSLLFYFIFYIDWATLLFHPYRKLADGCYVKIVDEERTNERTNEQTHIKYLNRIICMFCDRLMMIWTLFYWICSVYKIVWFIGWRGDWKKVRLKTEYWERWHWPIQKTIDIDTVGQSKADTMNKQLDSPICTLKLIISRTYTEQW